MLFVPIMKLLRVENNWVHGMFGTFVMNDEAFCVTLEPPNKLNKRNISCIPALQYICERTISPKFGETFEIINVPDRSNVLFHPGNTVKDTAACIIMGASFGKLRKDNFSLRAVLNSGNTFKRFMMELEGIDNFKLTIKECY